MLPFSCSRTQMYLVCSEF